MAHTAARLTVAVIVTVKLSINHSSLPMSSVRNWGIGSSSLPYHVFCPELGASFSFYLSLGDLCLELVRNDFKCVIRAEVTVCLTGHTNTKLSFPTPPCI